MVHRTSIAVIAFAAVLAGSGCESEPAAPLAPTASALVATKKAASASKFTIDPAASKVSFLMEAPEEKIRGSLENATTGALEIDPTDLTKTTGVIVIDIAKLELFQTKPGEGGKPGTEVKEDLQNQHARAWLEIDDSAPEAEKKKNERVEFAIRTVEKVSAADVTKLSGAERKVTLSATGEVLLHQRKSTKTVELEATFTFDGDKPKSVRVRTVKPFVVGLAEHDVKPREAFGKLAQKTLELLAPKVAKEAPIQVDLVASLAGAAPPGPAAPPAAPAASGPAAPGGY